MKWRRVSACEACGFGIVCVEDGLVISRVKADDCGMPSSRLDMFSMENG